MRQVAVIAVIWLTLFAPGAWGSQSWDFSTDPDIQVYTSVENSKYYCFETGPTAFLNPGGYLTFQFLITGYSFTSAGHSSVIGPRDPAHDFPDQSNFRFNLHFDQSTTNCQVSATTYYDGGQSARASVALNTLYEARFTMAAANSMEVRVTDVNAATIVLQETIPYGWPAFENFQVCYDYYGGGYCSWDGSKIIFKADRGSNYVEGWIDNLFIFNCGNATVLADGSGDFPTIQAALNAVCDGDTVFAGPGTYHEHDIVLKDGVKLISLAGATATVIDAGGLGRVFLAADVGPSTEVVGFTLRGGSAEHGGGIRCESASPLLAHNIIVDNFGSGSYGGGGIFCTGGSDPIIDHNVIARNSSDWGSGGIYAFDTDDNPTIRWNTIVYNTTAPQEDHGGGIYLRNGTSATIENNIVCFNNGRGICGNGPNSVVGWNDVYGNVVANYCGTSDPTGTDGNISVDPFFALQCVGFAGTTLEDSLHLCYDSPCIDAGDPSATDPDGSQSDMGAYPFEGTPAFPRIAAVADVPNDQGRKVRIEWERSVFDGSGDAPDELLDITSYAVYRRIDDLPNEGWPSKVAWPSGDWDYVLDVPAMGEATYSAVVPTLIDSVPGQDTVSSWSWFFVAARTPDPLQSFYSIPVSGYSIDNLPPNVPGGFMAEPGYQAVELKWNRNREGDFKQYMLYRGTTPGFDPLGADPIAVLPDLFDTTYSDQDPEGGTCEYYYRLAALDRNENRSAFSAEVHSSFTTVPGGAPARYALYANVPNPFNPSTTIRFVLPEAGSVTLTVHDVAGRLVATLAEGPFAAGEFTRAWEGKDTDGADAPSGVYFARMRSGDFSATKKMLLVR